MSNLPWLTEELNIENRDTPSLTYRFEVDGHELRSIRYCVRDRTNFFINLNDRDDAEFYHATNQSRSSFIHLEFRADYEGAHPVIARDVKAQIKRFRDEYGVLKCQLHVNFL